MTTIVIDDQCGQAVSDEFCKFGVHVEYGSTLKSIHEGPLKDRTVIVNHHRGLLFNLSYMRSFEYDSNGITLRFNRQGFTLLPSNMDQAEARVIYGYRKCKPLYMSVDVDSDMAGLITALNRFGFRTEYCCSGHGDGEMYIVFDSRDIDCRTLFLDDRRGIHMFMNSSIPVAKELHFNCTSKAGKEKLRHILEFINKFRKEHMGVDNNG